MPIKLPATFYAALLIILATACAMDPYAAPCGADIDCRENRICIEGSCQYPPLSEQEPDTRIIAGPAGTVNEARAQFTFDSPTSPNAHFECKLDDEFYSDCSSPVTFAALPDGYHQFFVRARTARGNADATPANAGWAVACDPTSSLESTCHGACLINHSQNMELHEGWCRNAQLSSSCESWNTFAYRSVFAQGQTCADLGYDLDCSWDPQFHAAQSNSNTCYNACTSVSPYPYDVCTP